MNFGENQSYTQYLQEKWSPVLEHQNLSPIKSNYKKAVLAQLMENTATASEISNMNVLTESAPTNSIGAGTAISNYDPILISLIRRALPNMMPFDLMGVQPMTGPTGIIFAMRSRYINQTGGEAFYNEADTVFSGAKGELQNDSGNTLANGNSTATAGTLPNNTSTVLDDDKPGRAMPTSVAEQLGSDETHKFGQMAMTIERITATAGSRALAAEYSIEMAQDLKAIHGLDAEAELANMLSAEILAEINRECIRTLYSVASKGAQSGTTTAGIFDLDTDSNGRWSVERFKGLMFQIDRECNAIAKATRRGRGNVLLCSSDIASALASTGLLDYNPAIKADLDVDDTGNPFVGTLKNGLKVYIDPYYGGVSNAQELMVVGYKGKDPKDAGVFYCPYVPLQKFVAWNPETFQPKIAYKTRYAMVANPFAHGLDKGNGALIADKNVYYRKVLVSNLM